MLVLAQFEEQCSGLLATVKWPYLEKDRIIEPTSVSRSDSTEDGLTPELSFENLLDLEDPSFPRDDIKNVSFTVEMNAIFKPVPVDEKKDAHFNQVDSNVEVDNDLWSLLLELETPAEEAMKTETTVYSTNFASNEEEEEKFSGFDSSTLCIDPLNSKSALGDCEMLDDDLEQLFQLSTYPQIDSADDLSSLSAGSPCESTADMLANVICQTGLFANLVTPDFLCDTTLNISEILGQSLVEQSPEQVVPNELGLEEPVVLNIPEPVSTSKPVNRKRKAQIDNATAVKDQSDIEQLPSSSSSKKSKIDTEDKYTMMRIKNNEASKRSRQARKMKYVEMDSELIKLEEDNVRLKSQADKLEKAVNQLKLALTTTVMKLKV